MDKEEFNELLKLAGIKNKKELAELTTMSYSTINQWGVKNPYPAWLKSYLLHYAELQQYRNASVMLEKLSAHSVNK